MSVEDREILREVWEGRIPAVFSLAEEECIQMEPPDLCYLMLPRLSYLPITTDKVKKTLHQICQRQPRRFRDVV